MNIILFDNEVRDQLLPLTYTRPVCEIRVGILTIKEKWQRWIGGNIAYITSDYLSNKFQIDYGEENYVINGSVMPSPQLVTLIKQMEFNQAYLKGEELIVAKLDETQFEKLIHDEDISEIEGIDIEDTEFLKLDHLWDIFRLNDAALRSDFEIITKGRTSHSISPTNRIIGEENIFIEPGVVMEFATINASLGPVYIGKNTLIMEGTLIRGPLSVGEGSVVKMGTRIYGATTLGPFSKVGGELNNCVFQGYSNKSHDGYLGNSIIGEWCNLGADTNASNLKNTYSDIKLWNYPARSFKSIGLQNCGLIMGDHSKCGINTMFNTGTVVGVCCNIFGSGFPPTFIPSYSWGGANGLSTYKPEKAFETIDHMMNRREIPFSVEDRIIMLRIFEDSAQFRSWETEDGDRMVENGHQRTN